MAVTRKVLLPCALIGLALGLLLPAAQAQVIYRWVDENGEVHYNATLPPEYANRPHQILENGLVIKSITDPGAPEPTVDELEQNKDAAEKDIEARDKRMRADRLLVLKYGSEEEILDAMQVEIDNLSYDARLLEQARQNEISSIIEQIHEAANRQRAGMPIDPDVSREILKLRSRMQRGEKNKANLAEREAQIRKLFTTELERYRFLMQGGIEGEPMPETNAGESNS
jgi:hypothetical protein